MVYTYEDVKETLIIALDSLPDRKNQDSLNFTQPIIGFAQL